MDKGGNAVSENNKAILGMKVFTHITHTKLFFVADEVGCNTRQKGDGHIEGSKKICEHGCVLYQKIGKE